ncbi:MAG TPA: 23S rRNA (uracil(1939)-C(5))-methyltransferase RlmD [Terriglobales bacterium]|jgi:23S rRNA (uracil1939-C5)-methyltransferase|nr:23S rRNA (uracil(1939)-C(5))-methyltransferase RlmD [Terriglobales bacterium]
MLLSIEKLIYGGDGLARTPADADGRSMAVFVPFVLPGERADVEIVPGKAGFARGTVSELVERSPARVDGLCPYFERCGGCHYQHIRDEEQFTFKSTILRETLHRIAKIELQDDIRLHASPPWNYRNRTRLQVRTTPEFALGYFRFASHEFLPVHQCPISSPLINRVMAQLIALKGCECPTAIEEIELFADAGDQRLLAWAFCRRDAEAESLRRWAETVQREVPEIAGITFFPSRRRADEDEPAEGKVLAKSDAAEVLYRVQDAQYRVSAGVFFQVNRHLVDELVSTVTGNATGELALDLYAGVGLFSLALARSFHHILAVEASQTSSADLVHNAPANVKAVQARIEDYLQLAPKRPDLVVADPPRAGVGKAVARGLVQLGAPRVRYVSCDPSTLARDLVPLLAAGYRIEEAHLFDLFPQTFHIETVVLLAR